MIEKEILVAEISDLDTSRLHYVKVPENHIVIDFDIPDENVYNVKSLDKTRAYLDSITTKMTHEEIETYDDEWI